MKCSFCNATDEEVMNNRGHLIAGGTAGIYICFSCIKTCTRLKRLFPKLKIVKFPKEGMTWRKMMLDKIKRISDAFDLLAEVDEILYQEAVTNGKIALYELKNEIYGRHPEDEKTD